MPIYEYECAKCGVVDAMQRITEEPLKTCPTPKCRRKVRKLMSSTQFQLKGAGWYMTDYGKGGKKPSGNEGGGAEPTATSSPETGSGSTKPEGEGKSDKKSKSTKKTKDKTAA